MCSYNWDVVDASVVCRQLGFETAILAPVYAFFGEGTGDIWMEDVQCDGSEKSLFECIHALHVQPYCDHWEDAGVICKGKTTINYVKEKTCIWVSQI